MNYLALEISGFVIFLVAVFFAAFFGLIEWGRSGGLYTTNYDLYLGIMIAVPVILGLLGIVLFALGMYSSSKKKNIEN